MGGDESLGFVVVDHDLCLVDGGQLHSVLYFLGGDLSERCVLFELFFDLQKV